MNTKSVRFRLTIWYSAAFFIAMAVVFTSFYFLTERSLYSHTDLAITTHSQKIVEIIPTEDTLMNQSFINSSQVFAQQFSEMPGMLLIISDPYGKVLYRSQDLGPNEAVLTDLLEKSTSIIKPTFVNRSVGATPLRLGIFPAKRDGQSVAIVLMGQPVDVIQKSLNTLTLTLLLVYFGLLIPTIGGGFLLARGALSPITETSAKLKKISSQNLDERVESSKTGDEIEELTDTFNHLLDRLSEAFNRERQFIGDVAHELKTPLSTIRSSTEIALTKDRSKDEYKRVLTGTLVDIDRLSNTLKNVLDLAWSESDHSTIQQESFDLTELVDELKDLASKMGESKKIKINGIVEKNIQALGKREKIFRAILNILDNAVKFSPSDGKITLSLKKDGELATIKISDTGPGINAEDLPHIFERFYRGSRTAKVLGSGLGLAIASSVISVHQGSINVDSELGKGTTVTINLPIKTS